MIEVIYDNAGNTGQTGDIQGIRLPKNIRQIGTPQGGRRIYVEDYVITYLNQLAKPGNTYARGAILLGEYKQTDDQGVLFISGALEAQNVEFDLEEIEFTNEIWSEIYNDVKRYFPDLEVVGWFMSRMGFSTQINDKITKIHLENFSGRDKALYMIDSLEEEDAWYLFENNELKKQSGYYIYYTRNDAMQAYMMTQQNHMVESETDVAKRDQELLKNYRNRLEQREKTEKPERERKPVSFLYVASSLLTIAFLALGITVLNSYDRLKNLETAFNRMEVMSEEDTETPKTNVVSVNANVEPLPDSETSSENTSSTENTEAITEASTETKTEPASTESTTAPEPTETITEGSTEDVLASANTLPQYYTVQAGDTLSSISFSMYHSALYVKNIMDANEMENPDQIYVGQEIVIPALP